MNLMQFMQILPIDLLRDQVWAARPTIHRQRFELHDSRDTHPNHDTNPMSRL